MTLHNAIEKLLRQVGRPMRASEISDALNKNKWYQKKDNSLIEPSQICARINKYHNLFIGIGSNVSLVNHSLIEGLTPNKIDGHQNPSFKKSTVKITNELVNERKLHSTPINDNLLTNTHLIKWKDLSNVLRKFYLRKGIIAWYNNDEKYLSEAFYEIEKLWLEQFNKIRKIKYVMLSEAPLWGKEKKYIYNVKIPNSQFFYRSDLEFALNEKVIDKSDFIDKLNQIGFIIVDLSPFAFNSKDTIINYRQLSTIDYKRILENTIPIFFSKKIELINQKRNDDICVFYRYARVRNFLTNMIAEKIIDQKLIDSKDNLFDISQKGGGIDKEKLKRLIG